METLEGDEGLVLEVEGEEGIVRIPVSFGTPSLLCRFHLAGRCHRRDCSYAHSLQDQTLDSDRQLGYQALAGSVEGPLIQVYGCLMHHFECCPDCVSGRCVGGWNCRRGVPRESLRVCERQYLHGDCDSPVTPTPTPPEFEARWGTIHGQSCPSGIHLDSLGLRPYYPWLMEALSESTTPPRSPDQDQELLDQILTDLVEDDSDEDDYC